MVLADTQGNGQLNLPVPGEGFAKLIDELTTTDPASGNYPSLAGFSFTFFDAAGDVLYKTSSVDASGDATTTRWSSSDTRLVAVGSPTATDVRSMSVSRDDMAEFSVSSGGAQANFNAAISQAQIAGTTAATDIVTGASADDLTTTVSSQSSIDWVDEKDPPVKLVTTLFINALASPLTGLFRLWNRQ